jgi:hypothetical protein
MMAAPLFLAATLGWAPTNDDGTSRVVVLGTAVEGDLQASRGDELTTALRDGLARGEFELVDSPPDWASVVSCAPSSSAKWSPDCAAQAARKVGADYAVVMKIVVDRRDYSIGLEVIGAETGSVSASSSERCEVCGIAEARDVVDSQAAAIRARIESLTLAAPVVVFESSPPGAIIRLDGKLVGETPFERVLEPGPHVVEGSLHGYVAESQRLEAVAGVRSTVKFDLEPVPRSVRFAKLRVFGWVALGVGVAGVVTGATLVAIDGRPNELDCRGGNVDPEGDCKFVYGTLGGGIGALAAGGALLATGVGILLGTRDRGRQSPKRARIDGGRLGMRVGPRYLGVAGRF